MLVKSVAQQSTTFLEVVRAVVSRGLRDDYWLGDIIALSTCIASLETTSKSVARGIMLVLTLSVPLFIVHLLIYEALNLL